MVRSPGPAQNSASIDRALNTNCARSEKAIARAHLVATEALERGDKLISLLGLIRVSFAVHDHRVAILDLAVYFHEVVIWLLLGVWGLEVRAPQAKAAASQFGRGSGADRGARGAPAALRQPLPSAALRVAAVGWPTCDARFHTILGSANRGGSWVAAGQRRRATGPQRACARAEGAHLVGRGQRRGA